MVVDSLKNLDSLLVIPSSSLPEALGAKSKGRNSQRFFVRTTRWVVVRILEKRLLESGSRRASDIS